MAGGLTSAGPGHMVPSMDTEFIGEIDPQRLYTGVEAARLLSMAPRTLIRWRQAGDIEARWPRGRTGLPRYLGADIIAARERRA